MTAPPAERSTRDGSVYGEDALNVSEGKLQSMSFNRMYRHEFESGPEQWDGGIGKYRVNTASGGWHVLPIQNAVQAAMRPRDWVALNNYFCKWRIKGFKVECANFNCQEVRPTTGALSGLDSTTIPNLYFECYVDADHLLPGYEQDFMRYATNNGYSTADTTTTENNGDIQLQKWHFINTLGEAVLPDRELNLANGPGYKFVKMTDNFDFSWSVDEKERRWRHTGQPWQYQMNEAAILQRATDPTTSVNDRDVRRDRTFPFQGNLSWGGFPGGRTDGFGEDTAANRLRSRRVPVLIDTSKKTSFVHQTGTAQGQAGTSCGFSVDFPGEIDCDITGHDAYVDIPDGGPGVATDNIRPTFDWRAINQQATEGTFYQNGGLGMGSKSYKDVIADQNVAYTYKAYNDQSARNQITGVPQLNTPPPLILFKANSRGKGASTTWQFWCKYSVVFEGHRNTLGFFPLPVGGTATSSWAGCGNLGFTTAPGAGNYNNIYDDDPWVEAPYDYPYEQPWAPASAWLSDTTRPIWPSGDTKEDAIEISSDEED